MFSIDLMFISLQVPWKFKATESKNTAAVVHDLGSFFIVVIVIAKHRFRYTVHSTITITCY